MKILHIVESTATGTLAILQLAVNHQIKKHDVTVIFSRRIDTPENIEDLFDGDVHLIEMNLVAGLSLWPIIYLRRKIIEISPAIIHCHSSVAGFMGRLASVGLENKVFYSPHCISFMREDLGFIKRNCLVLLEFIACVKPSVYIACSNSEKLAINRALPFKSAILLENAVDLDEFKGRLFLNNKDNLKSVVRVVTVGGIRPQKGPEEYAYISSELKNKNIEFIWIGDGPIEYKKPLLDAGVVVTGWLSRPEVIKKLHTSDIYLSTSLWEGLPVAVIEACAAKIPVILRDCAGNKDIVFNGKNGYLFVESSRCIDLLNKYLNNRNHFERLADAANEQVFDRFSSDRFTNKLLEIYNK